MRLLILKNSVFAKRGHGLSVDVLQQPRTLTSLSRFIASFQNPHGLVIVSPFA